MPEPSITCPYCKLVSYNENDIREQYCGNCKSFWAVRFEAERYAAELAEAEEWKKQDEKP